MFKQIMIPVAAFAITATSASAFSGDMLEKIDVDLTDTQLSALEEAGELRAAGAERTEIKTVLEAGDVDRDTMKMIREAGKEVRTEHRAAVKVTIEAGDYEAFKVAIGEGKLAENITSEADFLQLVEAHELKEAGDKEAAKEIMENLGFEKPDRDHGGARGERQARN